MGLFARKISSYFPLWNALTPQFPQLSRPHALTASLAPLLPLPQSGLAENAKSGRIAVDEGSISHRTNFSITEKATELNIV